jgi:hypothetical protein
VGHCLGRAGIGVEYLSAEELGDPARLNIERQRVLAYVYGNTFPHAALANLRRFREAGGCVVAFGGVPFCHPCVLEEGKWVDKIDTLGWEFVSHQQLGTCVWGQAEGVEALTHAPGDPFGLGWLPLPAAPAGIVQFPRPDMGLQASQEAGYDHPLGLLPEDRVVPVVSAMRDGQAVGHPVCAIEHQCPEFRGAVDVWAGATLSPHLTLQQQEQLIVAATAFVLERVGELTEARADEVRRETRGRYVLPARETPRPFEPFIDRAPEPAQRITVLDVGAMPPGEQLLALSLQGLVNRTQPRIWVISQFQDERWLKRLLGEERERVDCPSLEALLRDFGGAAEGAIVYDPAEPHSVNVATTLAGVRDGLIATRELAERYDLRVLEDLRGQCADPVAAYERALEDCWPALNHRAAACLLPSIPAPRDYLIQHRLFTFWLDAEREFRVPPEQMLFFERLLSRLPKHAAIHGWWQDGDEGGIGEWRGVHVSSQYAKATVCTVGAYNLSALCGEAMPEPPTQQPKTYGSLAPEVYISFIISDGDNFGMNLYSVVGGLWEQPLRGKIPVGWGFCPTQVELTPGPVRYWYETATENDLLFTMDGLGYVYPEVYGSALGDIEGCYGEFLSLTQPYMERLGHRHLWFLGGSARAPQMAEALRLDGLFGEYGVPAEQRHEMLGETAAIWVDLNPWEKPWTEVDVLVERIRQRTPPTRPAFLLCGTNGFSIGPNQIAEIIRALGPGYIPVRPDELCHLVRKYRTQGLDADPQPRPPLDFTLPPPPGPRLTGEGVLLVREDDGDPEISGWYTDPQGTAWVRKRLAFTLPAEAKTATVHAYVRGSAGRSVTFRVNGHEHRVLLESSGWAWVSFEAPAAELVDGGNEVWYTGNPEARLFTAGDGSADFGHSDFGGPDRWSPLSGELMCYLEVQSTGAL